jgi:dolichol-phosphate mannosyltransferase
MLNNFFWNEVWTFRGSPDGSNMRAGWAMRLLKFNAICSVGIGFAVLLLNLFYRGLQLNLYLANLLAIMLVTLWNFWMNALLNWRARKTRRGQKGHKDL